MIAVAAVDAERSRQTADFFDALVERIVRSGDEIAGDDRQIGAEVIRHIDRAPNLRARHIPAHVNVADLRDLHAVERRGQIRNRDFDAMNLIVQAFGGESVHGSKEWYSAGSGSRGFEKVTPAGIDGQFVVSSLCGGLIARSEQSPGTFLHMNALNSEKGEQRAEKHEARQYIQIGPARNQIAASVVERVSQAQDDKEQSDKVQQADSGTYRPASPPAAPSPQRAIPEALGQVEPKQPAQQNRGTQNEPENEH